MGEIVIYAVTEIKAFISKTAEMISGDSSPKDHSEGKL